MPDEDPRGVSRSAAAPPLRLQDLPRQDIDDLVTALVERLEQRVSDELERRGRRGGPGSF